eukprot:gene17144-22658_t
MTRGNQREIDRQRAQNRHANKQNDTKQSAGDLLKKREADANALAEKVAKKKAAEEAAAKISQSTPQSSNGGIVKMKDIIKIK